MARFTGMAREPRFWTNRTRAETSPMNTSFLAANGSPCEMSRPATIYYYAEDILGSSRTLVQAGQTSPCYDADFFPFGGERDITSTCAQNYKFEGKERDTETNNDDFGARYYSSRLGRGFPRIGRAVPAPVPIGESAPANPQSVRDGQRQPREFRGFGRPLRRLGSGLLCAASPTPHTATHPFDDEAEESALGTEEENLIADLAQQEQDQKDHQAQQQTGLQNEQLKYKTVSGGQHANPWEIQWSLTHNTKKGGWIVQHIVADFKGAGHYDYWEAWPVAPYSHVPSVQGVDANGKSYSDMFAGAAGSHIHASARFYEGLTLPASFKVQPAGFPAGILRTTPSNPNLPTQNATAPNVRWWSDQ